MADEPTSQVFIIRMWRELHEKPNMPPEWRGVVEHLQSSQRVYFCDLRDMNRFIKLFIDDGRLAGLAHGKVNRVFCNIFAFLRGNRRHE